MAAERAIDRDSRGQLHVRPSDHRVAALAGQQHGVVSREQLTRLGLSADQIDRRLAAGRLHLVHRGVYAVGHEALTRGSRYLAAVLAVGEDAVLSHRSAAALWGIRQSQMLEVTPHPSETSRSSATSATACGPRTA